jgi:hydroxyethylthiazole kinase-like uncharacterized protein yjeF
VACPEIIRPEVAASVPELMTIGLPSTEDGTIAADALAVLQPYLEWADAIALGPGMGTHADTGKFVASLLEKTDLPLVIDADGLNLIAAHKLLGKLRQGTILTPHPGEYERLAQSGPESTFQLAGSDFYSRAESARSFAEQHHLTLHLKGAPSITFDAQGWAVINSTGNPGLATGGAGDVLTGIISALRAQAYDPFDAAWIGAYLHGLAADLAEEQLGEISLVAGDVIRYLPMAFRSLTEESDEHSHDSEDKG